MKEFFLSVMIAALVIAFVYMVNIALYLACNVTLIDIVRGLIK